MTRTESAEPGTPVCPAWLVPSMSDRPNYLTFGAGMIAARRVRVPSPSGTGVVDHSTFGPVLDDLATHGIGSLPGNVDRLVRYRSELAAVAPHGLGPAEALAYWVNLYNAGALLAASEALAAGATSVLRLPNAFGRRDVTIDGEALSLDDIEHGKVRRFGDPRIHAALVCGSVSCPTLRHEPFTGSALDDQLDDQMRTFLALGGASVDREGGVIRLSSIFLLYGRDFTRPDRMPALGLDVPGRVRDTIAWWLPAGDRDWVWSERPKVEFQPYDWGLACTVARGSSPTAG